MNGIDFDAQNGIGQKVRLLVVPLRPRAALIQILTKPTPFLILCHFRFDLTAKDNVDRDSWIHALCAARDTHFDEQQNRKDWSKHKDGSICLDAIGESDALEEAMKADYSYDLDEAADVQDIFTLTLRDLNGVDSRLGDVMSNRLNLILLCGQFGSPTTKRLLADLMRHVDFLEDLYAYKRLLF